MASATARAALTAVVTCLVACGCSDQTAFALLRRSPTDSVGGSDGADDVSEVPMEGGGSLDASTIDESSDAPGSDWDTFAPCAPNPGRYLHTAGTRIVDATGNDFKLIGLNWFGLETTDYAPHGLDKRKLRDLLRQVHQDLHYNTLRIPFSNQLFEPSSYVRNVGDSENHGLSGLEMMDRLIEAAAAEGLRVILDHHRGKASDSNSSVPQDNQPEVLWYSRAYPQEQWIADWQRLASRYCDPTVVGTAIGFDLHHELGDPATWGDASDTSQNNWRNAAEKAGNAILDINPNLLIIVSGIQTVDGKAYWQGGNLLKASTYPVRLVDHSNKPVSDKLVYSAHDYPPSVSHQSWFDADAGYPGNLIGVWDQYWGYLFQTAGSAVMIGAFGTKFETDADRAWLKAMSLYIQMHSLSFAYWSLNPDSATTGGLLEDDWITVNQAKQDALAPARTP